MDDEVEQRLLAIADTEIAAGALQLQPDDPPVTFDTDHATLRWVARDIVTAAARAHVQADLSGSPLTLTEVRSQVGDTGNQHDAQSAHEVIQRYVTGMLAQN